VIEGRLINILGAGGHSAIAAMEIFWRAGGLVQVNAMFPPGSNIVTLILVNFYGLNPLSMDVALEAKRRGVVLITVNSHQFA